MNTQQKARHLRSNMTDAERKLWQSLRQRQLNDYKFRRQQPLGPYIVDFICFEARLIVELDGSQHQQQEAYDQARDTWLREQSYRVLRFWNNAVFENRDGVLMSILAELTPPTLTLPRKGGGNRKAM